MAAVLKAKPLEIESPEQRGAIIDLAEGNPQIAVIAARVATERRSVIGLNGDELLQRYIAYLIPTAMPFGSDGRRQRQLLAVIAALDGIEDDDEAMIGEIGEMLRMTPDKVRDELDQLAETGLVIGDHNRHRIKPDLLAEHVLFALTLTDRWQLSIEYPLIFGRFGDRHLARLAKAIGALPFSLFDNEVTERLRSFERAISSAVEQNDLIYAATLVREISHGRPVVAKSLASKLLKRAADIDAGARERIGAYHLTDARRRVESSIEGLAMRWVWARVDELERVESRRDLSNFWDIDFLEDDLAQVVSSVATDSDLDAALKRFERVPNSSPALQDLAKVIGWIDGSSVKVTKLMVDLLNDEEEAGYRARAYLMELPINDEQLDLRALAFATELDEPLPALLALIDGGLPTTWSGSYVPHLEQGLGTAKRWSESEDHRLRQAGVEASKILERQVRSSEERERLEELEFEYT